MKGFFYGRKTSIISRSNLNNPFLYDKRKTLNAPFGKWNNTKKYANKDLAFVRTVEAKGIFQKYFSLFHFFGWRPD